MKRRHFKRELLAECERKERLRKQSLMNACGQFDRCPRWSEIIIRQTTAVRDAFGISDMLALFHRLIPLKRNLLSNPE